MNKKGKIGKEYWWTKFLCVDAVDKIFINNIGIALNSGEKYLGDSPQAIGNKMKKRYSKVSNENILFITK